MNNFLVDILTPEKVIAKDIPAQSLLIPTVRGQINVLPEHTHIVSKLSTGELSIFGGADDPDRHFTVTYGICKVLNNKIVILSNTSEENTEIDHSRAQKALDNAEGFLKDAKELTDHEYSKYMRKIERAKLRMQMADSSSGK